ncbi:MAG: hypothetical protein Q9167_000817 [Letrouitia subvulpina]
MEASFHSTNISRPYIPLSRSISHPNHSDQHPRAPKPTLSFPLENPRPISQEPALAQDLTIESIKAQWLEALAHFDATRLQSSLSSFRRLLRSLLLIHKGFILGWELSIVPDTIRTNIGKVLSTLYTNVALIHGFLGSHRLSAEAFEEAVNHRMDNALAWYGLGIARFLLRKFEKAIRAWDRCIACFVILHEDGNATGNTESGKAQKFRGSHTANSQEDYTRNDEIVYKVHRLAKRSAETETQKNAELEPHQNGRLKYAALEEVQIGQGLENGAWRLEKTRVEWNLRIAIFERNFENEGTERPGNGAWGLNGICAGVIFGPPPEFDASSGTSINETYLTADGAPDKVAKEVAPFTKKGGSKGIRLGHRRNKSKEEEESVKNDKSGKAGALMRQKWSTLQQKMLKRRSASVTEEHEETTKPYNSSPQSLEGRMNESRPVPSPSPSPSSPKPPLLTENPPNPLTPPQPGPFGQFQTNSSLQRNDLFQCQERSPSESSPFLRPTTAEKAELEPIYESDQSCHHNIANDVKNSRNGFPRRTSSLTHSLRMKRHRNASLSSFHSQDIHTEPENSHQHLQSLDEEEQAAGPPQFVTSVSHNEFSKSGEPDIYLPNLFNDLLNPSPPLYYPPPPPRIRSRPCPRPSPLSYHAMTRTATTFFLNHNNSEQPDHSIFGEHSGYLTDEISTLGSTQHGRFFASLSPFNSRRPSDASPHEPSSLENSSVIGLPDESERTNSASKPYRGHKRTDTSLTLRPSDATGCLRNGSDEPQTGTATTGGSFAESYDATSTPATDFPLPHLPHYLFPSSADLESRPSSREGELSSSLTSDGGGVSPKSHPLPRKLRKQDGHSALNLAHERRMSVSPLRINVSALSQSKDEGKSSGRPMPSSDTLPPNLLNAHVMPMPIEEGWEIDDGFGVPAGPKGFGHVGDMSPCFNDTSHKRVIETDGEGFQPHGSEMMEYVEEDEGGDWRQWRDDNDDEPRRPSEWAWEEAYEQWMAAGQSSVFASSALNGYRVQRVESPHIEEGECDDPALGKDGVLLPRAFEGFSST